MKPEDLGIAGFTPEPAPRIRPGLLPPAVAVTSTNAVLRSVTKRKGRVTP